MNMFYIFLRDGNGGWTRYGKTSGYLMEQEAEDAIPDNLSNGTVAYIGEGKTLAEAKQNAKQKAIERTGDASVAHRNVMSR